MKTTTASFADLPKTYEERVAGYLPRPIHDVVGYQNTVEMIDALAGHIRKLAVHFKVGGDLFLA